MVPYKIGKFLQASVAQVTYKFENKKKTNCIDLTSKVTKFVSG